MATGFTYNNMQGEFIFFHLCSGIAFHGRVEESNLAEVFLTDVTRLTDVIEVLPGKVALRIDYVESYFKLPKEDFDNLRKQKEVRPDKSDEEVGYGVYLSAKPFPPPASDVLPLMVPSGLDIATLVTCTPSSFRPDMQFIPPYPRDISLGSGYKSENFTRLSFWGRFKSWIVKVLARQSLGAMGV